MCACRGRRRGFTLIEISVVVLIIALMLTTATVQLDRYLPGTRNEAAGRALLDTLDLARTHAIAQGLAYEVEIDLGRGGYQIIDPYDQDGKLARDPEQRQRLVWHALPDGVSFGGLTNAAGEIQDKGTFRVRFDPSGSAQAVWIYLKNAAGDRYDLTVQILPLTGVSKIAEGRLVPVVVTEDDL